jgi:hypothetical protein
MEVQGTYITVIQERNPVEEKHIYHHSYACSAFYTFYVSGEASPTV